MSKSLWLQTAYNEDHYPSLNDDIHCDVCIIGGGLSGIANAYFLAKAGKNVVLLEKDNLLAGATGNSTGKLTAQHDLIYAKLLKTFGRDGAKLYYDVNEDAIQFGRTIASDDEIYEADSILYAQSKYGTELLQHEQRAYKEIGIDGEIGTTTELPIQVETTLTIKNESQIHPVRFGQKLARLAVEAGARIYESADVVLMDFNKKLLMMKAGHEIKFEKLILCSHYPIEGIRGMQILKLSVDRSYIVAAETTTPLHGQYIAVDEPKRSIRTAHIDGKTYFLLSSASHRAGASVNTKDNYNALYNDMGSTFNFSSFVAGWSAQDPQTPDLVPYAGVISSSLPHVYISTGYRKWGLTNSIASAKIISDQILGVSNKATALYAPNRTGFGSLLLQALMNTGLVVMELATGYTTRLNAPTCTHMGCKTRWNTAEETWDCPCHGSRFRSDGSVLEGPATKRLKL